MAVLPRAPAGGKGRERGGGGKEGGGKLYRHLPSLLAGAGGSWGKERGGEGRKKKYTKKTFKKGEAPTSSAGEESVGGKKKEILVRFPGAGTTPIRGKKRRKRDSDQRGKGEKNGPWCPLLSSIKRRNFASPGKCPLPVQGKGGLPKPGLNA